MNENRNKSKKKIVAIVSLCTVTLIITMITLALWDGNYTGSVAKVSTQFVDKARNAQKAGGTVEVSKGDLNSIISMYFKTPKTIKNVMIKGIYGDMKENNVVTYVPMSYKNINFLISTQGDLALNANKIVYTPKYFKLGKLPIPKYFVFDILKKFKKDGISFDNNQIAMEQKVSPISVSKIEIQDNKITLNVEKSKNNIENILKSITNSTKKSIIGSSTAKVSADNKTTANSSTSKTQTKEKSQTTADTKQNTSSNANLSERDALLRRISKSLYSASNDVSGSSSEVIQIMASSVENMIGNPSASPSSGAGAAKAAYSKLSSAEKIKVKMAIYSNLDGEAVSEYQKIFGN